MIGIKLNGFLRKRDGGRQDMGATTADQKETPLPPFDFKSEGGKASLGSLGEGFGHCSLDLYAI